jgi:hypothetical protein
MLEWVSVGVRIGKALWTNRKALVDWLFLQGPIWLRVPPLIFLVIFVATGGLWLKRTSAIQDVSIDTLTAKLEQTPQPSKGIEALLLAGLDQVIDEELGKYRVTSGFKKALDEIQNNASLDKTQEGITDKLVDKPSGLHVQTVKTESQEQDITTKYLTDDRKPGFLFVPAMLVGVSVNEDQLKAEELDAKIIVAASSPDDQVSRDILSSQRITQQLYNLLNIHVFESPGKSQGDLVLDSLPVQTYFVTRTGVLRICETGVGPSGQSEYYLGQFKPTTFFPDRPYFWKTVNDPSLAVPSKAPADSVRDSFYVTKPYIDLGGNGIVVTLSKCIRAPKLSKTGLFLDFGLGTKAKQYIRERLNKLGGTLTEITCDVIQEGQIDCVAAVTGGRNEPLTDKQKESLVRRIKDLNINQALAEVFGQIQVIDDGRSSRRIAFTIPVGSSTNPPAISSGIGRRSGSLLYCELDLAGLQTRNLFIAGTAGFFFMLFLVFVVLLVADYLLKLNEQDKAFQSIADAMLKAPVAYCRLNEQDKFVNMNKQFAVDMLGYKSILQATNALRDVTFEQLLADDESVAEYKKVQKDRRGGQSREEYKVKIFNKDRTNVITVEVYGGAVPMPKAKRKDLPQTFGILIEHAKQSHISEEAM